MVIFNSLHTQVQSGGINFPLYIAFVEAEILFRICEAPAFKETTKYNEIAANVQRSPVIEWQRPIDNKRTRGISTLFDDNGEFMPNPVLLSENEEANLDDSIIQITRIGNELYRIQIDDNNRFFPLWIIDGQHRIKGLGQSRQKLNKIPVVLLLNDRNNSRSYNGNTLAKIFAQVTTTSKKLDEIHNEWLTYAFNLDKYINDDNGDQSAFKTVLKLCETSSFHSGSLVNPFYDNINFNKSRKYTPNPSPGGFAFNCADFQDLIKKYYFSKNITGTVLSPDELAEQIVFSHKALQNEVTNPANKSHSVFFGDKPYGQLIIHKAFIGGILSYLRFHGPLNSVRDWEALMRKIGFSHGVKSDWNFHKWTISLSGSSEQKNSFKIALDTFQHIFTQKSKITNLTLDEFFRGDDKELKLAFYEVGPNGSIIVSTKKLLDVRFGRRSPSKISLKNEMAFKIESKTLNIGTVKFHIRKVNNSMMSGFEATYLNNKISRELMRDNKGYIIEGGRHGLPNHIKSIEGDIEVIYYGDDNETQNIEFKWD